MKKPKGVKKQLEFLTKICAPLERRANAEGVATLSEIERIPVLIRWAKGVIGNGGFQYFYEQDSTMDEVAQAFATLKFHEAADACLKSMMVFPNGVPPKDQKNRSQLMEEHFDEYNKVWENLEHFIWNISYEECDDSLVEFIFQHQSHFKLDS